MLEIMEILDMNNIIRYYKIIRLLDNNIKQYYIV